MCCCSIVLYIYRCALRSKSVTVFVYFKSLLCLACSEDYVQEEENDNADPAPDSAAGKRTLFRYFPAADIQLLRIIQALDAHICSRTSALSVWNEVCARFNTNVVANYRRKRPVKPLGLRNRYLSYYISLRIPCT